MTLLKPDPQERATSAQALRNPWIKGVGATEHNLLPEIKTYMARAKLRRGIDLVKLANRIEALKMQEDEEESVPQGADVPADPKKAAEEAMHAHAAGAGGLKPPESELPRKRSFSKLAKTAIFREVVLAKVREMKAQEEQQRTISEATGAAKH
ncbi:Calmodulin-dependent protein kinase cmk2 [Friedmanniomyces endolithicus]|nr:Calmodulin-dependent protein kinase cmk2 [Friedmanniomyces endolithicus]